MLVELLGPVLITHEHPDHLDANAVREALFSDPELTLAQGTHHGRSVEKSFKFAQRSVVSRAVQARGGPTSRAAEAGGSRGGRQRVDLPSTRAVEQVRLATWIAAGSSPGSVCSPPAAWPGPVPGSRPGRF